MYLCVYLCVCVGSVFAAMDSCSALTSDAVNAHTSTESPGTLHGTYLVEDINDVDMGSENAQRQSGSESMDSPCDLTQSTVLVDMSEETQSPTSLVVSLEDVHFAYKSRPQKEVLCGVNLRIPDRSITVIVGKNGSGMTKHVLTN